MQELLINIDELWLKGKNRNLYYRAIMHHLKFILKDYGATIKNLNHLLFVKLSKNCNDDLINRLQKIPGLYAISPIYKLSLDHLENDLLNILATKNLNGTFKVFVKRHDKRFPKTSVEMASHLGALILKRFNLKVMMTNFNHKIEIRIQREFAYLILESYKGIGGLPLGTSGYALSLISGGFDSPVASFLMNKRGLKLDYVFFFSYPMVGMQVLEKVKLIVSKLASYQINTNLYVVNIYKLQKKIMELANERYRTLFYRIIMTKIASLLASKINAQGLITGDALSQVSSQTLSNIQLVDEFTPRILRPLIGLNKSEILKIAREIDIFDIAAIPHDDACAMLAPENPIITPKRNYVIDFFKKFTFDYDKLIADATIIKIA